MTQVKITRRYSSEKDKTILIKDLPLSTIVDLQINGNSSTYELGMVVTYGQEKQLIPLGKGMAFRSWSGDRSVKTEAILGVPQEIDLVF